MESVAAVRIRTIGLESRYVPGHEDGNISRARSCGRCAAGRARPMRRVVRDASRHRREHAELPSLDVEDGPDWPCAHALRSRPQHRCHIGEKLHAR